MVCPVATLLDEARTRAGKQTHTQETDAQPVFMLPITIPIRNEQYSMMYNLTEWQPKAVAARLAHSLNLNEAEEAEITDTLGKAVATCVRQVKQLDAKRAEKMVQVEVYVRVGKLAFRDLLVIDIGAMGGITSRVVGVTTQYLSSVCSDLKLDESVWYNPIQKAVYAVIQEASEDLREAPQNVNVLPPMTSVVRDKPRDFPRIEEVNAELDAIMTERSRQRQEKRTKRRR